MFSGNKRPTVGSSSAPNPTSSRSTLSAPSSSNSAHNHPAFGPSVPGGIQTRIHVTSSMSHPQAVSPFSIASRSSHPSSSSGPSGEGVHNTPPPLAIPAAGSVPGPTWTGLGPDQTQTQTQERWTDVRIVHPAWEGFGRSPGGKSKL
ncbi:hypothetical protein JCM24511_01197 [Saitozyma sp. JCM 24511]|nr:hypothetical protein JCM24511_01197 [Saitozyma sp. JCM 24511]